jgi:6-phosphofructokinase 1
VNAIVRAFTHAARRLSIEVVGSRYGFEGLLANDGLAPVGLAEIRGILPKGGCALGCSTRVNPFYAANDDAKTHDLGPVIVDRLGAQGVEGLVLVGGDGTTVAAARFSKLGMPCLGIPKTIDNDLGQTDVACGFDSAVETATRAIDALHSTAEAHSRVMLVEVMGRGAGFLALHAGVAGGADVILVPEIPYRLERIVAKIREREALGLRFSIVVVSEGAKPEGGEVLEIEPGRPGHLARLGGAGERLRHQLDAVRLGHEVRVTVLGHLQRGGSPSAFDRNLGAQLGTYAAELCNRREYGRRIVLAEGRLMTLPLPADGEQLLHKRLGLDDPLLRTAHLLGIELGAAIDV